VLFWVFLIVLWRTGDRIAKLITLQICNLACMWERGVVNCQSRLRLRCWGNKLKYDTDTETEGLAGSHTPYIQRYQLLLSCWSSLFHSNFCFHFYSGFSIDGGYGILGILGRETNRNTSKTNPPSIHQPTQSRSASVCIPFGGFEKGR
jgi:hypothetical protein